MTAKKKQRETVDKRQRRQENEPTCNALDKLSEPQARRGIIKAESVRRIPCRLRKQAVDRKKVKKTPSLFSLSLLLTFFQKTVKKCQ